MISVRQRGPLKRRHPMPLPPKLNHQPVIPLKEQEMEKEHPHRRLRAPITKPAMIRPAMLRLVAIKAVAINSPPRALTMPMQAEMHTRCSANTAEHMQMIELCLCI